MRRGSEPSLIDADGMVIGVDLSADFCAEHEWGITHIVAQFGLDKSLPGFDGLKIQVCPEDFVWLENKKVRTCGFGFHSYRETLEMQLENSRYALKYAKLFAAWNADSFFVAANAKTKEAVALKLIYDHAKSLDLAFGFHGTANPFSRSGLCLFIRSLVPNEFHEDLVKRQTEEKRLQDRWRDDGGLDVMEELSRKKIGWFALGTRFSEDRETNEIKSWLNPMNQRENESCWVTVQDLKDWLRGTGKIVKQKGVG